jgi:hypothetical protein
MASIFDSARPSVCLAIQVDAAVSELKRGARYARKRLSVGAGELAKACIQTMTPTKAPR